MTVLILFLGSIKISGIQSFIKIDFFVARKYQDFSTGRYDNEEVL